MISTEQSEDQMQSVEIVPYQTGKLSVPAFQNGEAQDQQTKSTETVHRRLSAEDGVSKGFDRVKSKCEL